MLEIESRGNETLERVIAYLLDELEKDKSEISRLNDELEAERRTSKYWWELCQEDKQCLKTE